MQYNTVDIKKIFDSYEAEIRLVEDALSGMFESEVFLIPLISRHIIGSGGKRLRPLFLLAASRMAGYRGGDHIKAACAVEAIHTASLLHDDVVDGAELRRGRPSAHSLWGNQTVILVGDYIYATAVGLAVKLGNIKIMDALAAATTRMSRGEILQLQKSGDPGISLDEYTEIITAKTGILISAACRIGAVLGGCPKDKEDALAAFGLKAGIAFQMADDMLDYMADEKELGKRMGKDLAEGKVTLPLICLLKSASPSERAEIGAILKSGVSDAGLYEILGLLKRYGSIGESFGMAKALVEEAKAELSCFPPSAEKDEMCEMADYALQRDR